MLDLANFLKLIKELDMFAIWRPGPYICAEWELGGFPSWMLRDPNMKFRTNYKPYMDAADKYFAKMVEIAAPFQFTNGGPIIMVQIENEYPNAGNKDGVEYLQFLKNSITKHGVKELLFMCNHHNISGVFQSTNLGLGGYKGNFDYLKKNQPNRPLFISEFWSGWFDVWGDNHNRVDASGFANELNEILKLNSSANFYMFHGGTNFGFMNGAEGKGGKYHYKAYVTSYDFTAPLSEDGNYTDFYNKLKHVIDNFNGNPKTKTIPLPPVTPKMNYGSIKVTETLPLSEILNHVTPIESDAPLQMELINLNGKNYGQNFGFILYRTTISKAKSLKLNMDDRAQVFVNNKMVTLIEEGGKEITVNLDNNLFTHPNDNVLDILVENLGRQKFGGLNARKGINGNVYVDEQIHKKWKIFPLEFKEEFVNKLKTANWKPYSTETPAIYRAVLDISGSPKDTFLKFDKNWNKGVTFINGFNVGRYFHVGPQTALYIPSPLLKTGKNDIYMFELHSPSDHIEFDDKPHLG
jgi:hypothetical protein